MRYFTHYNNNNSSNNTILSPLSTRESWIPLSSNMRSSIRESNNSISSSQTSCRSSSAQWRLAPRCSNISMRTPPEQRSFESSYGPPAGFGALSTIPMPLWDLSRHSWLSCALVQTKPESITAPSLCEWPDLAFIFQSRISLNQGTTRPLKGWLWTTWWSHTHTMERRTLCHLGRDRHWHLCFLISERHIRLRWFSSWSSSQEERRQVRRNFFQFTFFPLDFEIFGPINQVGSNFFVRWVNDSLSFLMILVKLLFSFDVFLFLFSASILFVSTTYLEICQHPFWTSRDAPRVS